MKSEKKYECTIGGCPTARGRPPNRVICRSSFDAETMCFHLKEVPAEPERKKIYQCNSPDYCNLRDTIEPPCPQECGSCNHLKEKTCIGVHFPEGFDGLRTTIQYALPYMGKGTYYQQAHFIALQVREWQNNTSKIPGTLYRREESAEPTSCKPAEPEKRYECAIGNKRYSNRPPRGCHIRFPSWKNCTDDGLPCHNLKDKTEKAFLEAMKEKFAVEPELVICPRADGTDNDDPCHNINCSHRNPHKQEEGCRISRKMISSLKCGGFMSCHPYDLKTIEERERKQVEDKPHENQCETCKRKGGCYFHPGMAKQQGLDVDHPITIPEFIERFGCASYIDEHGAVGDQLAELYEQLGNLYHLRGDRQKSAIFYGVMVLLKQQKFSPEEIHEELQETLKEIAKIRQQ